jgi:hypothetical protein
MRHSGKLPVQGINERTNVVALVIGGDDHNNLYELLPCLRALRSEVRGSRDIPAPHREDGDTSLEARPDTGFS